MDHRQQVLPLVLLALLLHHRAHRQTSQTLFARRKSTVEWSRPRITRRSNRKLNAAQHHPPALLAPNRDLFTHNLLLQLIPDLEDLVLLPSRHHRVVNRCSRRLERRSLLSRRLLGANPCRRPLTQLIESLLLSHPASNHFRSSNSLLSLTNRRCLRSKRPLVANRSHNTETMAHRRSLQLSNRLTAVHHSS